MSTTSSPYRVMLVCEVSLPPPQVRPPRFSGIVQSVSRYTRSITPRSHANAFILQNEEGPSIFVSGAEAIAPKYLILYSKPSTTLASPARSQSSVSLLD